jgi:ubiquinone/menaquinone biosynthesis C-methylase UbiE
MPKFDHFGVIAPLYDRAIRLREPEQLIRVAGLPVDGSLLDAGGGTGRVSHALRGMAYPLVVADVSFGMLLQAKEKGHLAAVGSHTEKLPFPDNTFDRVIMVDAMHHVINHKATADELWRVVLPGGRIVIEEPDIRTIVVKVVAVAEKLALMRSHFISPPRIQALFPYKQASIRIERQGYNAWVIIDKRTAV